MLLTLPPSSSCKQMSVTIAVGLASRRRRRAWEAATRRGNIDIPEGVFEPLPPIVRIAIVRGNRAQPGIGSVRACFDDAE